jgi:uncharacterized protein (DUF433 family)
VNALNQQLDDPQFPQTAYRHGASGITMPVIRGTGIRIHAVAVAHEQWGMSPAEIAEQYDLSVKQIEEALAFFAAHRTEIENHLALEERIAGELNS